MELRSLRERLKMRVAAELDLTRDVEDAEIARMIDRCILEETKDQYVPLKEKVGLRVELFNSLRRLDNASSFRSTTLSRPCRALSCP